MHEFGVVRSLVGQLMTHLEREGAVKVREVHLRRGRGFSEEALRHAFQVASVGTPFERAVLAVETVEVTGRCPCGHTLAAAASESAGPLVLCPACGAVNALPEDDGLQLLSIVLERDEPAASTGRMQG